MAGTEEPRLDRPITLTFQGDWGQANMHRICGWLSQEIWDRSPAGSRFGIWSGRGGRDAIAAVLNADVDVAVMTPTAAARMLTSDNPLAHPASARLRALGTLPQRDRLVTCVDAALGISRMDELGECPGQLRIATCPDDGVSMIGLAAHRLLSAVGAEPSAIQSAGGRFLYSERPPTAVADFRQGAANVLIQEAVIRPEWQRITELHDVVYLDVDEPGAASFAEWQWPTAIVEAGFLPALDRDLTALEFADFLLVCSDDLPDDVGSMIAWCLVETRDILERQYRHIPPEHSPISYPIQPQTVARTPIPLHPGAEEEYAALGVLSQ